MATLATVAAAFAASSPPAGSVHQVLGKNGCYTEDGARATGPRTCHNARGGQGATSLAISPDGRFAYMVGYGGVSTIPPPVLSVFHRDRKNGTLHQLAGKTGCFSRDGSSEDGPHTCTNARDLDTGDATSIVISSDGRFLYVASQLNFSGDQIGGVAIFKRNLKTGTLRQLRGKAGCLSSDGSSEDGPGTCTLAREVGRVSNVHITPDQKFLYASDYQPPSGIAVFRRNSKNGTLRQLSGLNGCISQNGTTVRSGTTVVCRAAPNLSLNWDVATPGNRFAYVASLDARLVQAFKRNSKGGLVPLAGPGGCVSDNGLSPAGPCVDGRGLENPIRVVPSRSGRFLYVASYNPPAPVTVLNRNPKTGLLSERPGKAACVSADGTSGVDEPTERCRNGRALNGAYAGALSPDGRTLYFSQYAANGLVIFRISPTTGAFTQLPGKFGCVTANGKSEDGAKTCEKGRAIEGAYQVALGSRGRDVYVSAYGGNGVALFYAKK